MPSGHSIPPGASSRAVSAVLDRIEAEATAAGLPAGTVDRIVLVAGEVISNALEHGTAGVTLVIEASSTAASMHTTGQTASVDASLPVTEATRGRGRFLIRTLSDSVEASLTGCQYGFSVRPEEDPLLQ